MTHNIVFRNFLKEIDLYKTFEKVVKSEVTRKQVGLTRFVNQIRFQITVAEERWATIYYDFLQG